MPHQAYKPKTVKRKFASLKSFSHFLEYRNLIEKNPFNKIQVKLREPVILPKIIPLHTVEIFLSTIYKQRNNAQTIYQRKKALRDAAVIEMLFAIGMRISKLCSLQVRDANLYEHTVLIYRKGAKERIVQLGSDAVIRALMEYQAISHYQICACGHFFCKSKRACAVRPSHPPHDKQIRFSG